MDDLHEDHNETIVVNGSHEEYDGHNEDRTHDENIATMGAGVVAAKKKKKKSKSKSKRGLVVPSRQSCYTVLTRTYTDCPYRLRRVLCGCPNHPG